MNTENLTKLYATKNKSVAIFLNTILDLRNSQGFYSRLFNSICEMDDDSINELGDIVANQNFTDSLDVVLWLEA